MKKLSQKTDTEILSDVTGIPVRDINSLATLKLTPESIFEAMKLYGQRMWEEACEEQIEMCSDKLSELIMDSDDMESWPKQIRKTTNAEYPY